MAYFPFMIQLDDKKCLVAGGGRVAHRKVRQLLEFGASVKVVAPDICDEIYLIQEPHRLFIEKRKLMESDIEDQDVVILATNDSEMNSRFAAMCKERKILVNVVDVKKDCGFYFPAVIKQDEVVISVSTGGSSPLLAATIKKDIQENLNSDYGKIARELEEIREEVLNNIPDENERKKFFEKELRKRL